MVVLIVERVPASLRGALTRWMIEPKAGVFVGSVSAMVRERLWLKVCAALKGGRRTDGPQLGQRAGLQNQVLGRDVQGCRGLRRALAPADASGSVT